MQVQQLRYFVSLVEQKSYTYAARECLITQPALSQQIKALEQEIGTSLVTKAGRNIVITPAGQSLYNKALAILKDIEDLCVQVKRVGDNIGTTFRLGILSSMDVHNFAETTTKHLINSSGLELIIEQGSADELYQSFRDGTLKAFIAEEKRFSHDNSFNKIRLFANKLYLETPSILHVKHTGVKKLKVDSQEIAKLEHVFFVCPQEHIDREELSLQRLLHIDNLKIEAVSSILEGRQKIFAVANSGLIVDRSLMRGDSTTYAQTTRYEILHRNKSVKRHLNCYVRQSVPFEDLSDLYNILMEFGIKKYRKKSYRSFLRAKAQAQQPPFIAQNNFSANIV